MGALLVNQSSFLEVDPFTAFRMFGQTEDAGWILSARVTDPRRGAITELAIPLPGTPAETGGHNALRGTARISEITPWRRIVLQHESPWSGETIITFTAENGGTRVRAVSDLTPDAIGWMKQHLGEDDDDDPEGSITIGLMMSLSGEAGLFGRAIVNCAQLAADEINRDGGIGGRPVRIAQVDEGTDPEVAKQRLQKLLNTPGMAAVVGSHTSNTLNALLPTILAKRVLYLYAPVSEGGARVGNLFRLGESSQDQLRFAIPRLARQTGGRSWYLLGNDYSWPREIARVAKGAITSIGGRVVRERYVPFNRRRFDDILADIVDSDADMLVSSLVGFDSVDFERAFVAAGLRDRIVTLSALMEDSTLDHLGSGADGIWSSLSYFGGEAANGGFLQRYTAAWGRNSPPPSTISASVYDSVHLWATAARAAGSTHPDAVAQAMHGASVEGSRGPLEVSADGTIASDMYLARVTHGAFEIDDRFTFRGAS
ncbi:ABC transporter substrate-binding protein [Microbacterium saperdae]